MIDEVDTSIGISEDRLDRIFEEITQAQSDTPRKFGRTGLGFTTSRRLTELQDGSISMKSERDKWITFTMLIPYAVVDQPNISFTMRSI